jgi:RNA polymerase sigma-70 factor (ECF subfamily)
MKKVSGSYLNETDEELASLVAGGSEAAFNELYSRYGQKMFSYFFRMLWKDKERAEDLTQEVFMKIVNHAYRFETDRSFSTWLYSIANNICKNEYRKAAVRLKYKPVMATATESGTEKNTDLQKFKKALSETISKLSEEKKALFVLRFQDQLSVPDISQVLKIPEGTIKSRIFYLLKELKEDLDEFKTLLIYP